MQLQRLDTMTGQVNGIAARLQDMTAWNPVVTQARKVVLDNLIVGMADLGEDIPEFVRRAAPSQNVVEQISDCACEAAKAGRLIDFGFLPNAAIKQSANRGGPLYNQKLIGHPFREPWLLFHTWEDGAALYLVSLSDPDAPAGGDCEVIELTPLKVKGEPVFMIGDRLLLETSDDPDLRKRYSAYAIPSIWRYMPSIAEQANNGGDPPSAAAGNTLDPLMTALLILSTRGIERTTIAASDKLQKARARHGRPPIPPYQVVDTAAYITALGKRSPSAGRASLGGTHASPIPHLRMGHPRNLPSGRVTFVRDALVNMTADVRAAFNRSHYRV